MSNFTRKKIGVLGHVFTGWGGGIDFLRLMLSYLDEVELNDKSFSKIIILPRDDVLVQIKNATYPFRKFIKKVKEGKKLSWEKQPRFSASYLENTFTEYAKKNEIIFSGSFYKSQLKAAINSGADIVFPCIVPPPIDFKLPWVGYLADFQHHHIPSFFSNKEISHRNIEFSRMLNSAKHIIVYGKTVIKDAELFYPGYTAKLHALPFTPCPEERWLLSNLDVRGLYGLKVPYFIISNQFWRHKDHTTAIRAFGEYCANGGEAQLVCTGGQWDYRFPGYFDDIKILISDLGLVNRVKMLGHISKEHQISLLKNAIALVQPTLSEGAPGGGSCFDAISLGTPVICTDIPINLEMNSGNVTFFRAGNYMHLAEMMLSKRIRDYKRETIEALIEKGVNQRIIAGSALKKILYEALG
jgi:glycosyltransferase involved in cell wall biosynthesis